LLRICDFGEGALGEVYGPAETLVRATVVYPYNDGFVVFGVSNLEACSEMIVPRRAGEGPGIEDFAAGGVLIEFFATAIPGGNSPSPGTCGNRHHENRRQEYGEN